MARVLKVQSDGSTRFSHTVIDMRMEVGLFVFKAAWKLCGHLQAVSNVYHSFCCPYSLRAVEGHAVAAKRLLLAKMKHVFQERFYPALPWKCDKD